MRSQRILLFYRAESRAVELLGYQFVHFIVSTCLQELVVAVFVGEHALRGEIVEGLRVRSEFFLLLGAAFGSAEVEGLEEEGDGCHDGGEHVLEGGVLRCDEDDRHEDDEDVSVDA